MAESPKELLRKLSQERARSRSGEDLGNGEPRPRCRENPREVLRWLGSGFVHQCVAEALTRAGCKVRYVQRIDYHPVWRVTLARPWPPSAPRSRTFRDLVRDALCQVEDRIPVQDLQVVVKGERLILLFVWEAFTGPGLLAIQPGLTEFLRRVEGGGRWDRRRVTP
jgi:hypothetical protein